MSSSDHVLLLEFRSDTGPSLCQHISKSWVLHVEILSTCLLVSLLGIVKYQCLSPLPLQIPGDPGASPLALSILQVLPYLVSLNTFDKHLFWVLSWACFEMGCGKYNWKIGYVRARHWGIKSNLPESIAYLFLKKGALESNYYIIFLS